MSPVPQLARENNVSSLAPDFRAVFESAPGAFLVLLPDDPVFSIVAVSDDFVRLTQVRREDLLGRGVFASFPENPDDAAVDGGRHLRDSFRRVITTRVPDRMPQQRYDLQRSAAEGGGFEERYWSVLTRPLLGTDGQVAYLLHATEEVTDRVRAEQRAQRVRQELLTSETRFRQLAETSTFGLVIADPEGGLSYLNPTMRELLGYTEEEVAAGLVRWDQLTPPEFARTDAEAVRQVITTGRCAPYEKVYVAKDGRRVPILIGASLLESANGQTEIAAFTLDLTERKRMERELQANEQRLRLAQRIARIGGFEWWMKENRILWSPELEALYGLPEGSFRGSLEEWQRERIVAEDALRIMAEMSERIARQQREYTYEFQAILPDGERRWLRGQAQIFYDETGEPVRMLGVNIDIDAQKKGEAERERLLAEAAAGNQELQQANRELEEFAYVASHDLQEPLRMVHIYTQLILQRLAGDDPALDEYAGFVQRGVRRMEELIRDLLAYSRTVHEKPLPVGTADLSVAWREAVAVLQSRMEESGATLTALPLPTVRGDTQQMTQVFQNLLSNALKYRRKDVPPEIRVSAERQGEQWVISVRDNGIGFDPQYAERIFGLFKRLHKDEYPGTGLGLAICQRIVERYGGRIWAKGRPGQGATFFLVLPGAEEN